MSHNVLPVCANCRKSATVSVSCTKCLQICCSACFSGLVGAMVTVDVEIALLTARICRRCQDDDDQPLANFGAGVQGLCPVHGKTRNLYCSNCSASVCGSCIDLGEAHDFHKVSNLATVYLEKASGVRAKMTRAEKLNADLHADNAVYGRNLELLEKAEKSVLKEIEAIAGASKLEVSRLTTARKDILTERLNVPNVNDEILEDLRSKTRQLSPYELLEQLPQIESSYDRLLPRENKIRLQQVDDIHCELIPQYRFTETVYRGFQNAADGDVHVCDLNSAYDVEWKLTIRKSDMIQVKPSTDDPEILKLRHVLVVTIPHPDYSKTVSQCFEFEGPNNTFDVVHSSCLEEEGYCSKTLGHLVMKIGIRCLNALVEKQLLNYQYRRVKKELSNWTKRYDNDHLVMHFHPKLSELQRSATPPLKSCQIKDDTNRCWGLSVSRSSTYNCVGAVVELIAGPDVCSDYFIELVHHSDPTKTICARSVKAVDFDPLKKYGKQHFVSFNTLKMDAGYLSDGYLHFRFGVRPVPSLAKNPVPSAASA